MFGELRNMEDILSGWWLGHPSEKYEFVNWDDDIPFLYGKIELMFQTTNQLLLLFQNSISEDDGQLSSSRHWLIAKIREWETARDFPCNRGNGG